MWTSRRVQNPWESEIQREFCIHMQPLLSKSHWVYIKMIGWGRGGKEEGRAEELSLVVQAWKGWGEGRRGE